MSPRRFSKMSVWVDLDNDSELYFEVEPGGEDVILHLDDVDIYARNGSLHLLAKTALDAQRAALGIEVDSARREVAEVAQGHRARE